ncbi:Helicase ARIP4 [Hypsibius exemplaris]|uniref:Helicase ARIP4 n=1 Tax=Hypsibius exemplaris TaxID=2072580 RepID=A0A1W0X4P7_HYPEX|nr:Helicase ARIP4 [Hypsibius exemplaris]
MTSISENHMNLIPFAESLSEPNVSPIGANDSFLKNGNLNDNGSFSSSSPSNGDAQESTSSSHRHHIITSSPMAVSALPSDFWGDSGVFSAGRHEPSSSDQECTVQIGSTSAATNGEAPPTTSTTSTSGGSLSSTVDVRPFLDLTDDGCSSKPTTKSSKSDAPLKKIEDFVAKTMAVKQSARRNIRLMKSTKQLNPETVRAMEEENARILEIETSETMMPSPDPEIEILTIEVPSEQQPQPIALRSHLIKPPPAYAGPSTSSFAGDDDLEIIDVSPPNSIQPQQSDSSGSGGNSGDIIFVSNRDRYPSVSSFHCDDAENRPDEDGKVLINVGRMKREPCIYVAQELVPHLKPHQIGGIRFMFATLIESTTKFANTAGNGAVLAHSMGLGKTLQVITFLDAIFRQITISSVLIVAPLNTMAHWMAEFTKWLPLERRPERLQLYCIRDQKSAARNALIKSWATDGGVLLIGYEKLRAIVDRGHVGGALKRGKKRKAAEADVETPIPPALPKPEGKTVPEEQTAASSRNGASPLDSTAQATTDVEAARLILEAGQIVICDEGHRIKSADAAVTKVLKKVKTRRRIILTGYPLQNNLMEYWCMIDFVRPFLLGNEAEFSNLFKNPIENGQCKDSTERDRKVMRQRTYILQRTLCRIVQRRDSRPLIAELPKKREFALIFKQTPSQANLCKNLFEELTKHRDSLNAVALYTTFRNITHHPAIFFSHLNKLAESANANIALGQADTSGPICQLLVNLVQQGKWERFIANLDSFKFDEIHSGKILFLKHLVEEAVIKLKEKIIIFTQSIDVLDYLQEYLPTLLPEPGEDPQFPATLRIDGSTTSLERERLINLFNDDAHRTQIFVISTEAGGIGINLTGGCRVVLMDVSWNPSKDIQAISRIYRYGQKNISSIYRLVGAGSMERCVFDRQTHKQFLFKRVIDDKSPTLALNQADIGSLFKMDHDCDPATWHKGCEEPFPEEAKNDDILAALDTSPVFRQYLSEAPKVMDSILEADDTAQLSEYERREADVSFHREKNHDNGSFRRNGGPRHGISSMPVSNLSTPSGARPMEFHPLPQRPHPNQRVWPSTAHGQPTVRPSLTVPPARPELVPLNAIVRDATVVAQIRQEIDLKRDFNLGVGDILEKYAREQRMTCNRHRVVDRHGAPAIVYALNVPGTLANYVVKSDGSCWRMMNIPMPPTPAAPPSPAPSPLLMPAAPPPAAPPSPSSVLPPPVSSPPRSTADVLAANGINF